MNYDKERRQQAKLERLNCNDPKCVVCGGTDVRCLERHHLSGRKFGDATAIVCRNCHRKLSDDQRDHPKPLGGPPTIAEIVVHALEGIADLLILISMQCREYAAELLRSITERECRV